MEAETIKEAIDLAAPGTNMLFSTLGALVALGAVAVLIIAAVSIMRAVRESREERERRRKPAMWRTGPDDTRS